jgi:hypothetical protein
VKPLPNSDSPSGVIQVHVTELRQMFNSMDPAPFLRRDLDPAAEAYIVEWARELPHRQAIALQIHVDHAPAEAGGVEAIADSIHRYFDNRALFARRGLRALFHRGRISLLIGLAFLASALLTSELLSELADPSRLQVILRESLLIGGWVAMWRPLEIFLYDWWPIRADIRLFTRLGAMPVTIQSGTGTMNSWPAR